VTSIATTLADVAPDGLDAADAARAVTEGLLLGGYQFLAYKTKGEATKLAKAVLVGAGGKAVTAAIREASIVADAVRWARDIVNEPSGTKSPTDFAAAAKKLLTGKGVKVSVLTEPQIKTQKMGGVLGVGQGSTRPPRFVKVTYDPPAAKRAKGTLALVGKGVTFDTGGISIKPAEGMEAMKTDMGGAAAVLAAMSTLRDLGVRHRVVAYAPMVENMPSGSAIRPGDVLKMRDGQTVEVLNTDAEGRLILADALSWAVDEKVDAIVDLATLTGACVVALGEKVAGLMGNDDGRRLAILAPWLMLPDLRPPCCASPASTRPAAARWRDPWW
jgi:leucyl aminopeptidase